MNAKLQALATSLHFYEYEHWYLLHRDDEAHALLCALADSNSLWHLVADFRIRLISAMTPPLPCETNLFFVLLLRYICSCKPEDLEEVDTEHLLWLKKTWASVNESLENARFRGVPSTLYTIDDKVKTYLIKLVTMNFFTTTLRMKGADPYKQYLAERYPGKNRPKQLIFLEEIFQPEEVPTSKLQFPFNTQLLNYPAVPDIYLTELLKTVADPKNILSVLLSWRSPFLTHVENFLIEMLHIRLWLLGSTCPLARDAEASYFDIRHASRGNSDALEKLKKSELAVRARAADMVPSFTEVFRMMSAMLGNSSVVDDNLEPGRLRFKVADAQNILRNVISRRFETVYREAVRQAAWDPVAERCLFEAAKNSFIQNVAVGRFRYLLHTKYCIDHSGTVDQEVEDFYLRYIALAETPSEFFNKLTPQEEEDANPLMRFIKQGEPFTSGQEMHLKLMKPLFFSEPKKVDAFTPSDDARLGRMDAEDSEVAKLVGAMKEPGNMLRVLITASSPILANKEKLTMAILHARLWLLKSDLPVYYGGELTYRHLYDAYQGDRRAKQMIENYKAFVEDRATDPLPSARELELMFETLCEHEKLKPGDFIYHIKDEDLPAICLRSILGEPFLVKSQEAETFRKSDAYGALVSDYNYVHTYLFDCVNLEPPRTFLQMKPHPEHVPYVLPINLYYGHYTRNVPERSKT